jgi:hypothetical protein
MVRYIATTGGGLKGVFKMTVKTNYEVSAYNSILGQKSNA